MKLKFLLSCLLAAISLGAPADARVRGAPFIIANNPSQSGFVGFDGGMFPFTNLAKMTVSAPAQSATNFIYPNNLLANTNLPNGSISTRMGFSMSMPSNYAGHYVFAVQGTVGGNGILFASNGGTSQPGTVYSKSAGTTLSGCSAGNIPPCTFTALTITGTNPQIEYDNSPQISSLLLNWAAGSTFSGMTSVILCKVADYNADNTCNTTAGKPTYPGGFSDDFLAVYSAAWPAHGRMLDVNKTLFNIGDSIVAPDWDNWTPQNAWSYNLQHDWWAIPVWFGSSSGTNSYTITCSNGQACTYLLTGGAPKDGDFVQFYTPVGTASTNNSPTLTVTDANAVTSSAIQIYDFFATQRKAFFSGTVTAGDTISLTFTTTPLGAYTCLSGGTRTTSAYTVLGGDTIGSISTAVYNIVNADATLAAQPLALVARNPNGGTGSTGNFQIGYASNACTLNVTANITGAATEVFAFGAQQAGGIAERTLYSAAYSSYLGAWVLGGVGGGGSTWPWLTQLQLAQAASMKAGVKIGCWLQTNILWSTASFTSLANLANANQCPNGTNFELANELWNTFRPGWVHAYYLSSSLGLSGDPAKYYMLRQRQLWGIASSAFGGITGNFHPVSAWQVGGGLSVSTYYNGPSLCGQSGCANGNQAYDRAVGVNYNSAPNRPRDFIRHLSQAPYFHGGILGNYTSAANYGTWSATSSSVASNVLTVGGTVTGTIWWNQGIAGCGGTYIAASNLNDPTTAQLTGKVTTTLNGAVTENQHNWTVTSTAGLSAGMGVWNATLGIVNATIVSVDSGTTLTVGAGGGVGKTAASLGTNDTLVFGGKAGTYRLNSTSCSIAPGSTITGGDVLGLQYAADNYCTASGLCATGNPGLGSVQDAFNWAYVDLIAGVLKNQTDLGGTSAGSLSSQIGGAFRALAANATTMGMDVRDYEGKYDGVPPCGNSGGCPNSVGYQTASMGLADGYGFTNVSYSNGWIGQMQVAFKNSSTYKDLNTYFQSQELAYLPAGSMTMKYVFSGNARWSVFNPPGDLYATPFQDYYAMCAYNGHPC